MRRLPSSVKPRSATHLSLVVCLVALLSLVIGSPLFAQQAPVLITQTVDNSVRTTLKGNVHPLARAQYDQGEAPSDMMLHRMMLVLKRSDQQEVALRRLIENQQAKNTSTYHQWLTPAQFGAQFGPAESDITTVTNWLQQSGFEVTRVSNGRDVIEFNGTVGQVKQAFGTSIHKYVVKGEEHWANSNDPSIPTALAPVIAGIDTLHNFLRRAQNQYVGTYSYKDKTLTAPNPTFTLPGSCSPSPAPNCYILGPYDFANIYDVLPLWSLATPINGSGQIIAIVGRTDINPSDAPTFWSLFGLDGTHAPQPTLKIITNGPDPGFTGDEPEADIDTQWSGAVAPGATIDYVTSASTETDDGIDLSALYIVDNNIAPVMSESYGVCEAAGQGTVDFYGTIWEQAAAQGISVMVSTGDNGAAGCDDPDLAPPNAAQYGRNVNAIASTQWNAAVGGTDFNQYNKWTTYWTTTNDPITQQSVKPNTYIPETTWDNSCTNPLFITLGFGSNAEAVCNSNSAAQDGLVNIGGGSGGFSGSSEALFGVEGWLKPTWQTGTGVPSDNARDLPDISMFASNGFLGTVYPICQADASGGTCTLESVQLYGGTSVASPAFAGVMALVNQAHGAQGVPGFVLYNLASKQPTAFHDIPSGSTIRMPCYTGSTPDCTTTVGTDNYGVLTGWDTTTGFDLATGLGSVDVKNLVNDWTDATFTSTATTLTISTSTITHGASVPVTVSVSPNPGTWSQTQAEDVAILVAPGTAGNPGIDWNNLTSGTVTWNTTLLPGGTYKVIAHYGGDKTFGGSYSSPSATVTVNPENSQVYMGTPPGLVNQNGYTNTVVYGSNAPGCPDGGINCLNYLLRADILNSGGNFCTTETGGEIACATGTIAVTDNGTTLSGSPFKLNSFGYAEDQVIQLTGGAHALKVTYSGDASYNSSNTTANVTVTPAATGISNVAASASQVNTGQQFTVTATVAASASYGVAPTGTVSFFYNTTQLLGTVQLTPTNGNPSVFGTASLAASLMTSIPTAGNYSITATYSGDTNYAAVTAGSSNSVPITVISSANFTLAAAPSTLSITAGGAAGTSTITITPTGGFSGSVNLAASGLPSGVTASFVPNPATTTSVLSLTASAGATIGGPVSVTVTGTSGALTATTTISLTVVAGPGFTLSANPASLTITPTLTGKTSTITVTDSGGFTGTVSFAASGLPTGVTAGFVPTSSASSTVLTLTAGATASAGTATVTITGTSGALTATTTISLTVTAAPNFTLSAAPSSLTITPTLAGGMSTITVNDQNGFTGSVHLAASGLPTGVTASFGTNPTTTTSVLTLTAAAGAPAVTNATVTITGTSGALTQTTTVSLTVTPPPGFTLAASPNTLTITQGAPGGTSTITVTDTFGFTGNVTLAATGLPTGVTAAFSPNPTGTTSTITLTAASTATLGTGPAITVTGTSGSVTATANITLTVAQGFTVPATLAAPAAANPGQSTSTTMTITANTGTTFTGPISYAYVSGLPTGATLSFSPVSPIASGATSPATVTLNIQTAGPFTGVADNARRNQTPRLRSQNQRLWLPLTLPLTGVVLVGLFQRRIFGRRLSRRHTIAGLCIALGLIAFLVACGSGSSAGPVVTVSPSSVSTLYPNLPGNPAPPAQTQQFSASVSNTTSQSVTWAVSGGAANGTIDQTGLYTAPAALPAPNSPITVTATSTATTTPGSATVNLKAPTPSGPATVTVSVTEGTVTKMTTFTMMVN